MLHIVKRIYQTYQHRTVHKRNRNTEGKKWMCSIGYHHNTWRLILNTWINSYVTVLRELYTCFPNQRIFILMLELSVGLELWLVCTSMEDKLIWNTILSHINCLYKTSLNWIYSPLNPHVSRRYYCHYHKIYNRISPYPRARGYTDLIWNRLPSADRRAITPNSMEELFPNLVPILILVVPRVHWTFQCHWSKVSVTESEK